MILVPVIVWLATLGENSTPAAHWRRINHIHIPTSPRHPGHLDIELAWREFLQWHRCATRPRVLQCVGGTDGDVDMGNLLSHGDTRPEGEGAAREGLRDRVFRAVVANHRVRVAIHAVWDCVLDIVRGRE